VDAVKKCTKCKQEKPLEDFSRDNRPGRGGRASQCKECVSAAQRTPQARRRAREKYAENPGQDRARALLWRENNPEKARAQWARSDAKNREAKRLRGRQWYAENPGLAAAHRTTTRAIASGRLIRQPCEECGATENIHAHHDDYDKPLEIRWLCAKHHMRLHAGLTPDGEPIGDTANTT
jgi:hypothetical protein